MIWYTEARKDIQEEDRSSILHGRRCRAGTWLHSSELAFCSWLLLPRKVDPGLFRGSTQQFGSPPSADCDPGRSPFLHIWHPVSGVSLTCKPLLAIVPLAQLRTQMGIATWRQSLSSRPHVIRLSFSREGLQLTTASSTPFFSLPTFCLQKQ